MLHPTVFSSLAELRTKFPVPSHVHVSSRSTLVVEGAGVVVEALTLDGALVVKAAEGARVGAWAACGVRRAACGGEGPSCARV